jgi:hypothetical protein
MRVEACGTAIDSPRKLTALTRVYGLGRTPIGRSFPTSGSLQDDRELLPLSDPVIATISNFPATVFCGYW